MSDLPPAALITTTEALEVHTTAWQSEPLLAIDTEANSLYVYREQVCLIQVSTREADFIIDPLSIEDISPLGPLMADPAIEKIFHDAEYDLMSLKRDFDFEFAGLFDTMLSARICGANKVGLASMLEYYFGVTVNKKHQLANWGQRPLSPDLLAYAQLDTHYLPELRDIWYDRLHEENHWEEAQEIFEQLSDVEALNRQFDPDGFWRIVDSQKLPARQAGIVRELYLFREKMAKQRNYPPFKIFDDRTLAALALAAPRHLRDLQHIRGMTQGQIRRYGNGILTAVERGRKQRAPSRPRNHRPDERILARYNTLKRWRKKRARSRGVESDVIVSRDTLWALARRPPRSLDDLTEVPGLGPWKIEAYGEDILQVLKPLDGRASSSPETE